MKLIHTADLHLSSPMESRFSIEQARTRKREIFDTFERMSDYAVKEKVTAILLCGDVFDSKTPSEKDVRRFFDIVTAHPSVDYLYISGNHDEALPFSSSFPENFKTFTDEWKRYSYQNADIYGVNLTAKNCSDIYRQLVLQDERKNIVMLHGQLQEFKSTPTEAEIILPLLAEKGIDYLALGHIHSFKSGVIDHRGRYCYSGCLEGRGYDECGEKGFALLTIEDTVSFEFIPFAARTIHEIKVDITGADGDRAVYECIKNATADLPQEDLVRVLLTGALSLAFSVNTEFLEEKLSERFFHASIKDRTRVLIDPLAFVPMSLEEIFYKTVYTKSELGDREKEEILQMGLSALRGEKVEFT